MGGEGIGWVSCRGGPGEVFCGDLIGVRKDLGEVVVRRS